MESAERRDIIDVHCHCFAGREQFEQVIRGLKRLREAGVRHLAVMGLVNTRFAAAELSKLIPDGFDYLGPPGFFEADLLEEFVRESGDLLFPMVDTRGLVGDLPELLRGYLARGFRGIKGLYLADAGNDLQVASFPEVYGISLEQYHRREWEIFAFAEASALPVLYHMDAGRYGDVMRAILDDFPRLRVNFPHFGIGRKAFGKILDHYPNAFTDIAYMAPHIRNNPASYRDFLLHYPDRVCFGSDALLYQPEIVLDYIELVQSLQLPEDVRKQVFYGNPASFLGLQEPAPLS